MTAGLRLLLVLVAAGFLAAGFLAAVAQSAAAPVPKKQPATSQKATAGGAPTTAEKRKRRRRRPGCNRFCRQAGGFGAPPTQVKEPVFIPRQRIRIEDGIISIRAYCRSRRRNCVGAILVDGANMSYGRANLWIERRDSRLVRVFVPRKARRYLRRRGRDRQVFATVPLKGDHPISFSRRLTLLPND